MLSKPMIEISLGTESAAIAVTKYFVKIAPYTVHSSIDSLIEIIEACSVEVRKAIESCVAFVNGKDIPYRIV